MNISFDLYKVFYYVCEFKSVTKTANFLHVSQPAITKHIKNLESNLGITLITKNQSGIQLTQDGEELYLKIKDPIKQLNLIEPMYQSKENNYEYIIKIIAGYSTIKKYLLSILSEFNQKHPNIKFEIGTYSYYESINRLKEGKADLIFLNFSEKSELNNDLIIEKCLEVTDIFVVNSECKHLYPEEIKLLELNKYPIICKSKKSVSRNKLESYFEKNNMKFTPKYELSNNWLIEEYVNMNLGIGLVTREFVSEELANNKLVEIKTDIELPKREIGYAIRKSSIHYKILKEFIKELKNSIK